MDSAPSLGPGVPVLGLPGPPPPGGTLTLARGRLFHWHLDLLLVGRRRYKETRLLDLPGVGNNSLSGFVKCFEVYGHKGLCEELVFVIATLERDDFLYLGKAGLVRFPFPPVPSQSLLLLGGEETLTMAEVLCFPFCLQTNHWSFI